MEQLGNIDDLSRLWPWDYSLEVGVFAALKSAFLPFSVALNLSLLLVLLFLSA